MFRRLFFFDRVRFFHPNVRINSDLTRFRRPNCALEVVEVDLVDLVDLVELELGRLLADRHYGSFLVEIIDKKIEEYSKFGIPQCSVADHEGKRRHGQQRFLLTASMDFPRGAR